MAVAVTARDSSGEIARQMQATGVPGMTLLDRFAEALIPYATAIVVERIRIATAQGESLEYTPRELAEFCYGNAKWFIAEKRRLEDRR